jgi:hypothetical protein
MISPIILFSDTTYRAVIEASFMIPTLVSEGGITPRDRMRDGA